MAESFVLNECQELLIGLLNWVVESIDALYSDSFGQLDGEVQPRIGCGSVDPKSYKGNVGANKLVRSDCQQRA